MKTPSIKFSALLLPIVSLGIGSLSLAAEPEAVPPAFEKPAETNGETPAEDPFDPERNAPKLIRVQVEFIELSHEALTKLLFLNEPKTTDATALRKQLQQMVGRNEAKVLETQIAIGRSGQKSTIENIHEFIYPTEFTPMTQEEYSKQVEEQIKLQSGLPANVFTPTAFDTRNVGSTLEIEPAMGEDAKIIELRLVPELIWHTKNTVWHEQKDQSGNVYQIQMPDFYTMKLNTSVTCLAGQPMMAAVLSPKDAKGDTDMTRKVVVFVKCDVLTVK